MPKLVVVDINENALGRIPLSLLSSIRSKAPVSINVCHVTEPKNLMKELSSADWVIGFPFPKTFIKRNQNLKGIFLLSSQIPESFQNESFALENIKGINSPYVARHAILLLHKLVKDTGQELRNLTIGIMGLGSIGKLFLSLVQPLCGKVITISRSQESTHSYDQYNSFLREADIILPFVSLCEETKRLFDKEVFF